MSVYYREAANAEEVAKLLRTRGRTIITAPPRCGKTTELIKYAEERYPNGRFAVVTPTRADHPYIMKLHWRISNGISFVDVVAKRLLGEKLEGEEVNEPTLLSADNLYIPPDQGLPIFADQWNLFPNSAHRAIMRRILFIAAVGTGESNGTEESENR